MTSRSVAPRWPPSRFVPASSTSCTSSCRRSSSVAASPRFPTVSASTSSSLTTGDSRTAPRIFTICCDDRHPRWPSGRVGCREGLLGLLVGTRRWVGIGRVREMDDAGPERLGREQLEVSRRCTVLEELEPRSGGRGMDEKVQLVEQTGIEKLSHHRYRAAECDG